MKKLIVILIIFTSFSCHFPGDNVIWPPEKTTVFFLKELQKGNIKEAKKYCSPKVCSFIDSCLVNGTDLRVVEVNDVGCKRNEDERVCKFCCINNSMSYASIKLIIKHDSTYKDNGWLIIDIRGMLELNRIIKEPA